jgi:hypothetical protein
MPYQIQLRRGTTAQNNTFTGAIGELTIDTQLNVVRVQDGSTAGGWPLVGAASTQTLTNKTLSAPTITGGLISDSTGVVRINSVTQSTNTGSGALQVAGGAGIVGNVNVGGNVTAAGNLTVSGTMSVGGVNLKTLAIAMSVALN